MKRISQVNSYDFSNYRLSASEPGIRVFIVIAGILNLLMLIPDIINLQGAPLTAVCTLRLLYSAICVVFLLSVGKFRSFKALSAAVAAAELLAVVVFLVVFRLYSVPDFMIQLLGIMLIILLVFMVPNRLSHALTVSVLAAAGFLAVSFGIFGGSDTAQYIASAIYLAAEIAVGTAFTLISLNYQRREYAANTELQKLYATDPLTQVGNRVRLEKEATKWLSFCSRHNLPLSLVIIDIDNMKHINDQHGHLTGDATICELVQIICGDLRKNDTCIRWGGDEFVLLLPGTTAANAHYLVERIRGEVEGHTFTAGSRITCSFGISDLACGDTLEKLLASADELLYQAKKQGKNAARGVGRPDEPQQA
jgi:diguanylate cyclase (GGDEF)-like protein